MGARTIGLIVAGVGLALFAAGAVLALLFGSEGACTGRGLETAICQDRAARMLLGTAILWSLATLAVLVGSAMVLVEWRSRRGTGTVEVQGAAGPDAPGAPGEPRPDAAPVQDPMPQPQRRPPGPERRAGPTRPAGVDPAAGPRTQARPTPGAPRPPTAPAGGGLRPRTGGDSGGLRKRERRDR